MHWETRPVEEQQEESRRKGRGSGPRSRLVEAIAVLLLARPMRAAEIAEALGYSTRYVSSYLSYWKTRGLFDYENGFWVLTGKGEEYARSIVEREVDNRASQYAALARKILEEPSTLVRAAMNDRRVSGEAVQSGTLLNFTAGKTRKSGSKRQRRTPAVCAQSLLSQLELSPDEQTVFEALLNHYTRWGSTYTYLDHLERELDADRVWLLSILRLLQSKKLVYIYTDRRLGVRVGFSKRIRDFLKECSEALGE